MGVVGRRLTCRFRDKRKGGVDDQQDRNDEENDYRGFPERLASVELAGACIRFVFIDRADDTSHNGGEEDNTDDISISTDTSKGTAVVNAICSFSKKPSLCMIRIKINI
jgi:hypothetical protein